MKKRNDSLVAGLIGLVFIVLLFSCVGALWLHHISLY